jgi:hypothetical protein
VIAALADVEAAEMKGQRKKEVVIPYRDSVLSFSSLYPVYTFYSLYSLILFIPFIALLRSSGLTVPFCRLRVVHVSSYVICSHTPLSSLQPFIYPIPPSPPNSFAAISFRFSKPHLTSISGPNLPPPRLPRRKLQNRNDSLYLPRRNQL